MAKINVSLSVILLTFTFLQCYLCSNGKIKFHLFRWVGLKPHNKEKIYQMYECFPWYSVLLTLIYLFSFNALLRNQTRLWFESKLLKQNTHQYFHEYGAILKYWRLSLLMTSWFSYVAVDNPFTHLLTVVDKSGSHVTLTLFVFSICPSPSIHPSSILKSLLP